MAQLFANNVVSVTTSALTNTATAMTVVSAAGFPTPVGGDYFLLTLVGLDGNGNENTWEIVRVTARSGNTLTVVRGQEGTVALAWPASTRVEMRVTAASLSGLVVRSTQAEAEAGTDAVGLMTPLRTGQAFGKFFAGKQGVFGTELLVFPVEYQLKPRMKYAVDAGGGAYSVILPNTGIYPGDEIEIYDLYTKFGVNGSLTIRANGMKINWLVEDLVCDVPGVHIVLTWLCNHDHTWGIRVKGATTREIAA